MDIQSAIAQRAGVGRYTQCLIEHFGPLTGQDELQLFYFDFKRTGLSFPVPNARQTPVRWCPGRVAQRAWKTIGFPPFNWLAQKADVYHFPNFIIPPLTGGRSVVSIHDVSFIRHPEAAEPKNLRYMNSHIRKTVARADRIITISAFSARELIELLDVPEEKITVTHLGLTHNMVSDNRDADGLRETFNLRKPYVLFVGTLEPRKNIPFLINVFERMTSFDGDLVIAGMRGWKFEPILERMQHSTRHADIRYLEYVDEAWLPRLYASAELFMFPSLYEGFGFPPLEAMRCGTPVLSSRAGSLPEVLGDAAAYVDEFDADAWAAAAMRMLSSPSEREAWCTKGLSQARQYTWSDTAQKTWNVYREVAG